MRQYYLTELEKAKAVAEYISYLLTLPDVPPIMKALLQDLTHKGIQIQYFTEKLNPFKVGDIVIFTAPIDGTETECEIVDIITDRGTEPMYKLKKTDGLVSGVLWKSNVLTLKPID